MKKNKPRKYIKGTAAYNRRKFTQYHQKKALEEGETFHPRSLARSMGKAVGRFVDEISLSKAAHNWGAYALGVIENPNEFKAMMNAARAVKE